MAPNWFKRPTLLGGNGNHHSAAASQNGKSTLHDFKILANAFPLLKKERQPPSPTENIHNNLIFQMSRNDESIRDILDCNAKFRADLEAVAHSASEFAESLGRFAPFMTEQVAESSVNSLDIHDMIPSSSPGSGSYSKSHIISQYASDDMGSAERQKHRMLMAAIHQIGKFYMLMSKNTQEMAFALVKDFESPVKDRQSKHRERCKQWVSDYNADILSLQDYINSMHQMLDDPLVSPTHKQEITNEIDTKRIELTETKKNSITTMIKTERHHYVHFAHKLQNCLKSHLYMFKDLYQQNVKSVPDFVDVTEIEDILAKGDKPTQLFLKLKRPQDEMTISSPNQHPTILKESISTTTRPTTSKEQEITLLQLAAQQLAIGNDSGVDIAVGATGPSSMTRSPPPRHTRQRHHDIRHKQTEKSSRQSRMPSSRYTGNSVASSKSLVKQLLHERHIDSQPALMLYDYDGQAESDMSAKKNTEIEVISIEGEWAYAVSEAVNRRSGDGQVVMGWVPLSYTSLCEELQDLQSSK